MTASTPYGAVEAPLNPLLIALAAGATFVAQSYAANSKHLTETFIAAERHRGFSFINVISTRPTFNKEKTFAYYKGRVSVTEEEAKQDLASALQFVVANQGRDLIGTFFAVHRPTFEVSQQRLAQAAQEKNGTPTMESILESLLEARRRNEHGTAWPVAPGGYRSERTYSGTPRSMRSTTGARTLSNASAAERPSGSAAQ